MLAWDTETGLIKPALQAPPLSVTSWATTESEGLIPWRESGTWAKKHFGRCPMTLANAPFDLAVLGNEFKELMPIIFEMLDADLIHDVLMRMKMYDIAHGVYSGRSKPKFFTSKAGVKQKVFYSLSCTHDRLLGYPLEKDEWRLRYGELRDVPIDQWPEGAKQYPLEDARATLRCHLRQDELEDAAEIFEDQFRQVRAHWAIHLMRCWGIRTDQEAVKRLDKRLEKQWVEVKERLQQFGLVRKNGSKDTKLAKKLIVEALGINCTFTPKGELLLAKLIEDDGFDEETARRKVIEEADHKYVSTDSESCKNASTPELKDYHAYGHIVKLRGTYVESLWAGTSKPIHSYFEPILETGRTSSGAPNLQNPPREPGVRECFMPRPGCVFVACDYDLAELRSLAQVCIDEIGYSNLADALNNGFDPHLSMAAQILGISYDEAKRRRDAGDDEIEEMRTLGKCANFGFPGALGATTFVAFAKATYGVTITEEEAKELKTNWLNTWPEMRDYFKHISNMMSHEPTDEELDAIAKAEEEGKEIKFIPRAFIKQHRSGRCRGRVTYTAACNTMFQGLTADAAKEALYEIAREQFCDPNSVLYGTHTVNFIHDENLVECREEIAHEVAMRVRDIMVEVYNKWTPDVPMTAEPCVMRRWSKKAKARWKIGGKKSAGPEDRLIPYEDAA